MHRWKKLMPEAYSEAIEFVNESRRLNAPWVRAKPHGSKSRNMFLRDWTKVAGGFWDRVRLDTAGEARRIDWQDPLLLSRAREIARANRSITENSNLKEGTKLSMVFSKPPGSVSGWRGDWISSWRIESWLSVGKALQNPDHPYTQWVGCDIDLDLLKILQEEWNIFWFYVVQENQLPRCWIRWAFAHLLTFRKVSDGTPCDVQLATYLHSVDLFVSADSNLIDIASRVAKEASVKIAQCRHIPSGARGVEALFAIISDQASVSQ
jgi:hypothetical protein